MKRGRYRKWAPWTAQDDMTLRKMWRQNKFDGEIGVMLGRSKYEISYRRRALGIPGLKYGDHTPEIREKIRASYLQRWKNPEIARRMLEGLARGRATWSAMPHSERIRSFI
jgi:hypothetical protein